jgi:DNA-binding transcriptional LysR family regulator
MILATKPKPGSARRADQPSERKRLALRGRVHHFDLRRLSYLQSAAVAGSIRAGAEILNTSPSALSRMIAKMENELQMPLIERHGRGVKLTDVGAVLVTYFEEQRARLEVVLGTMIDMAGLKRGAVTIALGEGFATDIMGSPLTSFSQRHPDIRINLQFGTTDQIVRQVIQDEAHVGLAYSPPNDPKLHTHVAKRHPMCAVLRPDHPFALEKRMLTIADLRNCRLGEFPGNYGLQQILLAAEELHHIRIEPVFTANSSQSLCAFAEQWNGVIVVPRFVAQTRIDAGALVALEIDDPFLQAAESHLVTRRGRRLPIAATHLLQHLRAKLPVLRTWE